MLKVLGTPRAARLTTIKTNVRLGDAVGPIHFTAIIAIIASLRKNLTVNVPGVRI